MSHRNIRYYYAAPAHNIGETLKDKIKRLMQLRNRKHEDGRKRVIPDMSYGHWAAGWTGPANPEKAR